MKRLIVVCAAGLAAAALAGQASAGAVVQVTIRHQTVGCHSWSVNHGPYKVIQTLSVKSGTKLVFTDNDVMGHTLRQLHGPNTNLVTPRMHHMGAQASVILRKPGTYVFTTKEGTDYYKGVVTKGPDNKLRLTVKVTS